MLLNTDWTAKEVGDIGRTEAGVGLKENRAGIGAVDYAGNLYLGWGMATGSREPSISCIANRLMICATLKICRQDYSGGVGVWGWKMNQPSARPFAQAAAPDAPVTRDPNRTHLCMVLRLAGADGRCSSIMQSGRTGADVP
jgi:hypothetical protein